MRESFQPFSSSRLSSVPVACNCSRSSSPLVHVITLSEPRLELAIVPSACALTLYCGAKRLPLRFSTILPIALIDLFRMIELLRFARSLLLHASTWSHAANPCWPPRARYYMALTFPSRAHSNSRSTSSQALRICSSHRRRRRYRCCMKSFGLQLQLIARVSLQIAMAMAISISIKIKGNCTCISIRLRARIPSGSIDIKSECALYF